MEKKRDYKYDNLKALLIFLVVLGHLLREAAVYSPACKLVYCFIFMFHMPAFVYTFGRFSKPDLKKAGYFLFLYLIFQIAYAVFLYKAGFAESLNISLLTPKWIMWFLPCSAAYIILSFFLPPTLSLLQKRSIFFFSVFLSLLVGFFPFIGMEFTLSRFFVFLPFFLLGRFEKEGNVSLLSFRKRGEKEKGKQGKKERRKRRGILYGITAISLTLLYYLLSGQKCAALWGKTCYAATDSTWYLRLLFMAAALCWIRFLIEILPNKKLPIVTEIGKRTLFIYLLHGFIVKPLSQITPQLPLLTFFVFAILIAALLYAMAVLFQVTKRKIFSIKKVSR